MSRDLFYSGLHGVTCGEWLSVGDADCAVDQRSANAVSVTWTGDVVEEDELALFGLPRLSLEFRVDNDCQVTFHSVTRVKYFNYMYINRSHLFTVYPAEIFLIEGQVIQITKERKHL